MKYWVWSENKATGPYSAEELQRLPAIGPKTLIRRAGTSDQGWTPLEKMPSLMQFLSEVWAKEGPPPPPPLVSFRQTGVPPTRPGCSISASLRARVT